MHVKIPCCVASSTGASASERYHRTQLHPTPSFATYHDMRMPIKYTYNFPAASKQQNTNIQIHINTHTHKPVQIHTNTYKSYKYIQNRTKNIQHIQIHTNTYKHIHAYTNIQTYMPTYLRTYIYTCYSYYTCIIYIYTIQNRICQN